MVNKSTLYKNNLPLEPAKYEKKYITEFSVTTLIACIQSSTASNLFNTKKD